MNTKSRGTIPFTPEAFAENKAKLERLIERRQQLMESLIEARGAGDLSENGAYHAAKFELGGVGRQLRYQRHLVSEGYIAEVNEVKDTATFGRTVTLKNEDKEFIFQLVSEHEANPNERKLSLESPIGQAVLNKKIGERVTVITPRGEIMYTIVAIG